MKATAEASELAVFQRKLARSLVFGNVDAPADFGPENEIAHFAQGLRQKRCKEVAGLLPRTAAALESDFRKCYFKYAGRKLRTFPNALAEALDFGRDLKRSLKGGSKSHLTAIHADLVHLGLYHNARRFILRFDLNEAESGWRLLIFWRFGLRGKVRQLKI
jgi:hypothetical protein